MFWSPVTEGGLGVCTLIERKKLPESVRKFTQAVFERKNLFAGERRSNLHERYSMYGSIVQSTLRAYLLKSGAA